MTSPESTVDDAELAGPLRAGAAALGLALTEEQTGRLVDYVHLVARWNATYNLTSQKEPATIAVYHVLDCLAAAASLARRRSASDIRTLLDVGSGAGLPGVVIAAVLPRTEVVCIDKVGKKTAFVTHAAAALGLPNVSAVHTRVETYGPANFDVIASRALGSLADLVAATRHLLRPASGEWMAMKGKIPYAELNELRGLSFHVEPLQVPGLKAERCVVWIAVVKE